MPYTNSWDDDVPAGTVAANLIDDHIRRLRLDLHERMDELVEDWTTDPVVPLAQTGNNVQHIGYDDSEAVGSKAIGDQTVVTTLALRYSGITTASVVIINLNEINTLTGDDWQVSNLYDPIDPTNPIPLSFVGRRTVLGLFATITVRSISINVPANTISITLGDSDGDTFGNLPVNFLIQLPFLVVP